MKKSLFLKASTILCFITLITAFAFYRMGAFNSFLFTHEQTMQTSPNGGKIPIQKTTANQERMSSSKSLVLIDNDPLTINKRKRDYLYYAITFRSEIFQDSLRRMAKPLPLSFQFKLDSIKFKEINWFYSR